MCARSVATVGHMLPWSAELSGRIDEHVIDSALLRGNPLGDPHERPLWVYVPPGYDDEPDRRYPTVYVIQGYTGHAGDVAQPDAVPPAVPRDRRRGLRRRRGTRRAIVVYVDAWTAYGGSQFVDSPGTGRYHSYLCDEVVPFVDGRYRTVPDRAHARHRRQVEWRLRRDDHADAAAGPVRRAGHPRGRLALRVLLHPRLRRRPSATCATTTATSRRGGTTSADARPSPRRPTQTLLMLLGVAACFSAAPDGTPLLPFDPTSGRLRAGRVAALAGLGPGADGGALRRGACAVLAGRLDRRRHPRRVVPRPRRPGVPRGG